MLEVAILGQLYRHIRGGEVSFLQLNSEIVFFLLGISAEVLSSLYFLLFPVFTAINDDIVPIQNKTSINL